MTRLIESAAILIIDGNSCSPTKKHTEKNVTGEAKVVSGQASIGQASTDTYPVTGISTIVHTVFIQCHMTGTEEKHTGSSEAMPEERRYNYRHGQTNEQTNSRYWLSISLFAELSLHAGCVWHATGVQLCGVKKIKSLKFP